MNIQKIFITIASLLCGNPAHSQNDATERVVKSNKAISGAGQYTPAEIEDVIIVKYDIRALRNSIELNDHVIFDFNMADNQPRVTIAKTK